MAPLQLPKGAAVQFFYSVDPSQKGALVVRPSSSAVYDRFWLRQTQCWVEGTLEAAFDSSALDLSDRSTWPVVSPRKDVQFVDRSGRLAGPTALAPRSVRWVREPRSQSPLLSLVFVRWGGDYSSWMDEQEANDGDWGKYGSPPSDQYMAAVVEEGLMKHPRLAGGPAVLDFEVFGLFVACSRDVWDLASGAGMLAKVLKGRKRTCFWMLWPAEWRDTGDPDFACYIERQALFAGMRACEAAGIRSGFPHPADQFELITSKSWMATLSAHPAARLPAATLVTKERVVTDPEAAAQQALATLEHLRRMSPFPVGPDEPPAPSNINKDGIKKGVVKLGWSWENRFVMSFNGPQQLQAKLVEMLTIQGCLASQVLVQEWVDFDFEMRLYFLPPSLSGPGARVEPARVECNEWGERDELGGPGNCRASFRKLKENQVLERWSGDADAWAMAKTQAIDTSQFLLAWLRAVNAEPVPMIRLDFMLRRLGPGKARVYFGEYCEMGACCLGWQEGPPTIWRAALDGALR